MSAPSGYLGQVLARSGPPDEYSRNPSMHFQAYNSGLKVIFNRNREQFKGGVRRMNSVPYTLLDCITKNCIQLRLGQHRPRISKVCVTGGGTFLGSRNGPFTEDVWQIRRANLNRIYVAQEITDTISK